MATTRPRSNSTTLPPALLRKALRYRGLFTRVAERLKRSRQHVGMVARGLRQSKPVVDALRAEIERIERAA